MTANRRYPLSANWADRYKHGGNISFDISFKYSTEQNSDHFLDSLTGKFKMNDSLYWYDLENTECVFLIAST